MPYARERDLRYIQVAQLPKVPRVQGKTAAARQDASLYRNKEL